MSYGKWIALCSNGAVSLGSYEAGVIAQLYADVQRVNRQRGGTVAIDVVVGASAGAVTVMLLSQAIATAAPAADLTKRLRETWIEGLGIKELLGDTRNTANSLFDPKAITKLAPSIMRDDEAMKREASPTAPEMAMWVALTNVDGIPYHLPISKGQVVAGMYADYEPLIIKSGVAYRAPNLDALAKGAKLTNVVGWNDVLQIAVTSAAFPFAFRSQMLQRDLKNYPGAIMPEGSTATRFNYVDGGVLNNNPLGRAIDAVSYQERLHHHSGERVFLIIDPDPTTDAQALDGLAKVGDNSAAGMPPLTIAGALVSTYFNDALYRDLDQALKTNRRIKETNELLNKFVSENRISSADAGALLVAAGLDFKKEIAIERIPSEPRTAPLAGAFAGHFGGFFDKRYREHDFAVGCAEARTWFTTWVSEVDVSKEPLEGTSPMIQIGEFKGLNSVEFAAEKDLLADRARNLVGNMVHPNGIVGVFKGLLLNLIRKWIRQMLDDDLR